MVAFLAPLLVENGTGQTGSAKLCKRRPRVLEKRCTRPTRVASITSASYGSADRLESDESRSDSQQPVFLTGDVVSGRYSVTKVLGRGASGTTFEAKDNANQGQLVALKVLSLRGMRSWKMLDLFKREGNALKSLSHPAIPDFIDSVELDHNGDHLFILVQRKAEGVSLQEFLDRGQRFTVAQVACVFRQLLEVLSYLGELNPPMLHRDVKPANVIVNVVSSRRSKKEAGVFVSLVDFGAVNSGVLKGTPGAFASTLVGTFGYMPPEAFGGGADVRSDLYAAAAIILFTVTGLSPSQVPQSRLKLDVEAVVSAPRRLELGNAFTVMRKLLEPAPEDRYQTARQALEALSSRRVAENRMESSTFRGNAEKTRRRDKTGRSNFGAFDAAFDDGFGNGDGFYSEESDGGPVRPGFDASDRRGRLARRRNPGVIENTLNRSSGVGKMRSLRQPVGSRVLIERDADNRLLRVFIPPRGFTAQTASKGAFAVAWTGFVGFWTAGVVTGGAPLLMGLFSLPFWYAGVKMGKRVADDLKGTTELVISAGGGEKEVFFFSLRIVGALGDVREVEGDSRDLNGASVDVKMYQNEEEVTEIVLQEGVNKHALGEDLDDVEQDWLCGEINTFLRAADLR